MPSGITKIPFKFLMRFSYQTLSFHLTKKPQRDNLFEVFKI